MYNPEAYNSLPSLRDAAKSVNKEVRATLMGTIREFFINKAAHKTHGIALLHKHFKMRDNERLVEYFHSSSPWRVDEGGDIVSQYAGSIVPRSFRLYGGAPAAYEFAYSRDASYDNDSFQPAALKLLETLQLDHIFGVRRLDDHDLELSVEVTEGRVNVMLPPDGVPPSELIEALWTFGVDDNDRCHCREHCWPTKEGHDQDHSCG